MLKERRHAQILGQLRVSTVASIKELSDRVDASGSTVRRDLRDLSERGLVKLTHGGAVLTESYFASFELDSNLAAEVETGAKAAIGAFAAAQILPRQTVIFDSSTTVLAAARELVKSQIELIAITNSLQIAEILAASRAISVIVVGGTIRWGSPTLFGNPGLSFLGELHADVLLLGTHSISGGLLTETSQELVAMKRAMIDAARRTVLLADNTKFRPPALFTICSTGEVDELITNADANDEALSVVRDTGVVVHNV